MNEQSLRTALQRAQDAAEKRIDCNFGHFPRSMSSSSALVCDHTAAEYFGEACQVCGTWELVFRNTLGAELSHVATATSPVHVLALGCGQNRYIRSLTFGTSLEYTYLGVDLLDAAPRAYRTEFFGRVLDTSHLKLDVLAGSGVLPGLPDRLFDVIVIDLEPHGSEWSAYTRVQHAAAGTHLIVLQCIGAIHGSNLGLAAMFLNRLHRAGSLIDFYCTAWYGTQPASLGTRDVYVIAGRGSSYTPQLPKSLRLGEKGFEPSACCDRDRPAAWIDFNI